MEAYIKFNNKKIQIKYDISSGGASTIYNTSKPNYVAKIFKPNHKKPQLERKLEVMINSKPNKIKANSHITVT